VRDENMILCRVIGNLVSSCKVPDHQGFKILAVRPVDLKGRLFGDTIQTIDCAQAGVGDLVLVVEEGGSCSQIMSHVKPLTPKGERVAVNKAIIAVVDYIEAHGELRRLEETAVPKKIKKGRGKSRK